MENQHRQIKGYRELTQVEIDLMNEIKTKGAELGELVSKLRNAEVYGALALILMELQKINKHLDKLLEDKPMKVDLVEYNLRPQYTIT